MPWPRARFTNKRCRNNYPIQQNSSTFIILLGDFMEVFIARYHDNWNNDNEPYMNDEDLYRVVFKVWDTDHSNFIDIDEYREFDEYYLDISMAKNLYDFLMKH